MIPKIRRQAGPSRSPEPPINSSFKKLIHSVRSVPASLAGPLIFVYQNGLFILWGGFSLARLRAS